MGKKIQQVKKKVNKTSEYFPFLNNLMKIEKSVSRKLKTEAKLTKMVWDYSNDSLTAFYWRNADPKLLFKFSNFQKPT